MVELFASIGGDAPEHAGTIAKMAGQFGVTWPLLTAQIINFCIVVFILYRFAFRPVLRTIDDRQKKISDGLNYAEEMKKKLDESEKYYSEMVSKATHEAQQIIHQAREKAKSHLEEQAQEAVNRAESMMKKANESIELERKKMMKSVRNEIKDLAVEVACKALGKTISDADRKTFNQNAAKELSASANA